MNEFVDLPPEADSSIAKKWKKLLHRAKLFSYIPFVEVVFVAGSMAMGNAKEDSDFDLIVGVKTGRIFTARAFCILIFGLFGWRRKKGVEGKDARNKFCFSHFVTQERYSLSSPHNEYWRKLYNSLVPIYGDKDLIQKFYDANAGWTGPVRNRPPQRFFGPRLCADAVSNGMNWLLSGRFGDVLEKLLKKIQIRKIEKSLKTEKLYKPRIVFNDSELEFHPHTKRIEEFCSR